MTCRLIEIGQIVAAQGIKGEMRMNSACDLKCVASYAPFYDKSGRQVEMTIKRAQKNQLIVTIDGICDRNEAEKMRGSHIFINREKLPQLKQDSYYVCDLKGLNVIENGQKIGVVSDVENYGANDILVISLLSGQELLLAMSKQNILNVDFASSEVTVCVPDEIEADDED